MDKILSKWAESNNAAIESISEDVSYQHTGRDVDNLIEDLLILDTIRVSRPKTIFS